MKKVAILQSSYIPWKGFFDIIHDVDLFLFYDDVQFTSRDWRTRNKIKTPNGTLWLTVPVGSDRDRLICEVALQDPYWAAKHWKTLAQFYAKAPYFKKYRAFFEHLYLERQWSTLSELNQHLTTAIARELLGITTQFGDSRAYPVEGQKFDRIFNLLQAAGAGHYVSGPSAKDYIDESCMQAASIELVYKSYAGYPEYPQFHPPFEHAVSILDLLFHTGADAPWYIWGWREHDHPPQVLA
jgi:hypothetical protein